MGRAEDQVVEFCFKEEFKQAFWTSTAIVINWEEGTVLDVASGNRKADTVTWKTKSQRNRIHYYY